MSESAAADGGATEESTGEDIVLYAGVNSTGSERVYHLPDPEDPDKTRCIHDRHVDRSWNKRPRSAVGDRRPCRKCVPGSRDDS